MLIGQFSHNIDTKGRLTIPQRFREELGDQFIITRGLDRSLFVYGTEEWRKLEEKIRALPLSKGRDLQRFFFANATVAECDSMGRALIPANLREYAGLSKETVIIGASVRAEIWNKEAWEAECGKMTGERIEEAMTELGF